MDADHAKFHLQCLESISKGPSLRKYTYWLEGILCSNYFKLVDECGCTSKGNCTYRIIPRTFPEADLILCSWFYCIYCMCTHLVASSIQKHLRHGSSESSGSALLAKQHVLVSSWRTAMAANILLSLSDVTLFVRH